MRVLYSDSAALQTDVCLEKYHKAAHLQR